MTRFVAAAAARVALRVASALEERASTSGASLVGRLGPGGASRSAVSTRLPPTLAATGRVWYSKEAGGSDEGAESGGAGESPRGAAQGKAEEAKAGKEEEEEQQQQQYENMSTFALVEECRNRGVVQPDRQLNDFPNHRLFCVNEL